MTIVRAVRKKIERGCESKSSGKSRVEVVEMGFPQIHARGYIINLLADICRVSER